MKKFRDFYLWFKIKLRWNCFKRGYHDDVAIFSAQMAGYAHYDTLFQCTACRRKRWNKTLDYIEH